jgi:hypothetical protein
MDDTKRDFMEADFVFDIYCLESDSLVPDLDNEAEIWTVNDDTRYLCSWNEAEERVPDDEDDSNGMGSVLVICNII